VNKALLIAAALAALTASAQAASFDAQVYDCMENGAKFQLVFYPGKVVTDRGGSEKTYPLAKFATQREMYDSTMVEMITWATWGSYRFANNVMSDHGNAVAHCDFNSFVE
jgi:hypothetical protein